ncbi:hypothetical protein GCM10007422_18280 [Pedobacter zeae]|uniref:histidine kinase n=1 Tax=Pedobacter zeae TaxID=1737356 RepID=A0ABQ1XU81_9SPHI|nr:hypothetical protein GCM10007422_18280 [Pedobacter zeae]
MLDLQSILEDVRLSLAPQILNSGAVISLDLGLSEITFVRRKLRSIFYNLLNNAIKYTPQERRPEIRISTRESGNFMVISVADNGIGMSAIARQHIFEKFKRIKTDVEGAGVGLYLVNTIVTSAGGKIEMESEEGKGSVFRIFLKLREFPA